MISQILSFGLKISKSDSTFSLSKSNTRRKQHAAGKQGEQRTGFAAGWLWISRSGGIEGRPKSV